MALVTFNENVDHYVKGDVVDLDKDELKRVDEYAEQHEIEKPYSKGKKDVSNTTDTPTLAEAVRDESIANFKADEDADETADEDESDEHETPEGSVASEDELRENANKQAVGETLPGQEGENPTDVADGKGADESDDDGVDESDPVETANDKAQGDDSESDQGSDDGEQADEAEETDEATDTEELDNDEPAKGTEKAKPATEPKKIGKTIA